MYLIFSSFCFLACLITALVYFAEAAFFCAWSWLICAFIWLISVVREIIWRKKGK